jgi:type IV pilus assembly protein PilQ
MTTRLSKFAQTPRANFRWSLLAAMIAAGTATAGPAHVSRVELGAADGVSSETHAEVRIHAEGEFEYSVFRLSNPPRLVVDLTNAKVDASALPKADSGLVRAVTATEFDGRDGPVARFVVALTTDVRFEAVKRGGAVVLDITPRGAPAQAAKPVVTESETTDVVEITGEATETRQARKLLSVDARESSGGSLVTLRTDGEVGRYEIEEVTNPPRLVIDLWGVQAPRDFRKDVDVPGVDRIRVGKHDDRARIVLDGQASGLPGYDVATTDAGLTLVFAKGSAEPVGTTGHLRGLDLSEREGFLRLKLDVDGEVRTRTVADGPRRKAIALAGVQSAAPLGRHKGPISAVNVARRDDGTVVVEMDVQSDVEHKVWQRGDSVFWDVRRASTPRQVQPVAAPMSIELSNAAHAGATARKYRGRRITLDVMDADIVNILRLFGDISGRNIVVAENVEGKVTIKLRNVPWDQALDVILKTKQLGKETRGGIIRIALQADLNKEREARLRIAEERRQKIPTTVRLIPVNYAVAKELVPQIEKLLSERGRVTFDERTNVIIVEDIQDNLDQSERLVRTLDTQTPQVLIEARMVEATTTFIRSLGIQWGGGFLMSEGGGNPTGLVFPANIGVAGGADDFTTLQGRLPTPGVTFPPNFAVNLPTRDAPTTGVGLNLGSIGNFGFLNARITAAETSGQAKTITAPKITTMNNKQAVIQQCVDIPITVVTQNQINTNVITACIKLDVRPHVTADGSILMEIDLSNDAPNFDQPVGQTPTLNRKQATTELLVRDGDTAVIGGIYTRQFGETFEETPFLSQIPLIGWLFKSVRTTDTRGELLVFLTPRIVNRAQSTVSGR